MVLIAWSMKSNSFLIDSVVNLLGGRVFQNDHKWMRGHWKGSKYDHAICEWPLISPLYSAYHPPLAKAPENILPVIMGKHQNVIRMANFMKFHLVNSAHFLSHFFLAEMTHKELLAFFASGAKGAVRGFD